MDHQGVALTGEWTVDGYASLRGGVRTGVAPAGLLKTMLDVDLAAFCKSDALTGWTLHASGYYPYGTNASARYVGDVGGIDNNAAYNAVRLYELWLQKAFQAGRLTGSVRVGQMGADLEFDSNPTAASFLNGAYGAAVAFSGNLPYPGYPFTALGARLELDAGDDRAVKATWRTAAFDGNSAPGGGLASLAPFAPRESPYNPHGVDFHLNLGTGVLLISELSLDFLKEDPEAAPDRRLPVSPPKPAGFHLGTGHVILGGFYHTERFRDAYEARLGDLGVAGEDGRGERRLSGDFGVYALWAERVFRDGPGSPYGLSAFVRGLWVPADRNFISLSTEAGAVYDGIFVRGATNDRFGFGLAVNRVSDRIRAADRFASTHGVPASNPGAEFALEWFYSYPLRDNWQLQPDLQWVLHPGTSVSLRSAVVLGVRSTLTF